MGVKHTIKKEAAYFLTLTVTAWVDVFTRTNHRVVIIDSLKFCIAEKGLNVFAYCLMSNHIHLLVSTEEPYKLSDVIRDFKRHTSKAIIEQIKTEPESRREWMLNLFEYAGSKSKAHKKYKFWKSGNHAIEVFTTRFIWDKIHYIHNNPVEVGLVKRPEDWAYSSASNYCMDENLLLEEVICIAPLMKTVT